MLIVVETAACNVLYPIMISTIRNLGIVVDVLEFGSAEAKRIRKADFPLVERLFKRLRIDRYLRDIKHVSLEKIVPVLEEQGRLL